MNNENRISTDDGDIISYEINGNTIDLTDENGNWFARIPKSRGSACLLSQEDIDRATIRFNARNNAK